MTQLLVCLFIRASSTVYKPLPLQVKMSRGTCAHQLFAQGGKHRWVLYVLVKFMRRKLPTDPS